MACFMEIDKVSETVDEAIDESSDNEAGKGRCRLDKACGDVAEIIVTPRDAIGQRLSARNRHNDYRTKNAHE